MRFIIHGAGSIGSLIGGRLAESGAEVVLIARHAHAAAINRSGLLVKSRDGDRVVKALSAVTHPRQITPSLGDVIILTVKSSQSAASIQSLRETSPEETPVVCMQNGVRNEEVAAGRFLRVYGGVLGISATFLEAGMVAHTRGELLSVGNYPLGCDNTGLQIAARLEKAGFRTATHESIMAVKWSKLILNLNNATFAIIDKHLQLGLVTPAISNFMADVHEEGLRALDMAGISLEDPNNPFNLRRNVAELRGVVEDPAKICAEANSTSGEKDGQYRARRVGQTLVCPPSLHTTDRLKSVPLYARGTVRPRNASIKSFSSPGATVRKSRTIRSSTMRTMTGGRLRRSLFSISSAPRRSLVTPIKVVGSCVSGAEPPPTTEAPSISVKCRGSFDLPVERARRTNARARRVTVSLVAWSAARAGISSTARPLR